MTESAANRNLTSITPFFIVKDLQASISHYVERFGFELDFEGPAGWIPTRCSFKQRGASFVQELSFIDDGLWGFEVTDADGYVLAFFRSRNE